MLSEAQARAYTIAEWASAIAWSTADLIQSCQPLER
jgi:hypothetical protein